MSYIGRQPQIGNFQICDAISVVNNQAAYTMQVGSVNVLPETANHMIVSLNGVIQAPGSSFSVSGSTITFASNLVTGDVINFIHILGDVLDLGVPSDDTVSIAKLTATGTKNSTTFLRGDNTFAEAGGGKIGQVLSATKTDVFTTTSTSYTDITGITINITPAATSSKVLVTFSVTASTDTADRVFGFQLVRGSTAIGAGGSSGSRSVGTVAGAVETKNTKMNSYSMNFLDSPSSTSALTYKLQTKAQTGGSNTVRINSNGGDQDGVYNFRTISTITVMEVLA